MAEGMVTTDPGLAAQAVATAWMDAFTGADLDAIVDLYHDNALFLGTSSLQVIDHPSTIREYLAKALFAGRPRTAKILECSVQVLATDLALVTGLDILTKTEGARILKDFGRFSFVVQQRGFQWKIAHFHRSRLPGAPAPS